MPGGLARLSEVMGAQAGLELRYIIAGAWLGRGRSGHSLMWVNTSACPGPIRRTIETSSAAPITSKQ